jgi:hypothetical protein
MGLSQFFEAQAWSDFYGVEWHGFSNRFVGAVGAVFSWEDPFHASSGCGFDELDLWLDERHVFQDEHKSILPAEGCVQERWRVIVAFLDGNRTICGKD